MSVQMKALPMPQDPMGSDLSQNNLAMGSKSTNFNLGFKKTPSQKVNLGTCLKAYGG